MRTVAIAAEVALALGTVAVTAEVALALGTVAVTAEAALALRTVAVTAEAAFTLRTVAITTEAAFALRAVAITTEAAFALRAVAITPEIALALWTFAVTAEAAFALGTVALGAWCAIGAVSLARTTLARFFAAGLRTAHDGAWLGRGGGIDLLQAVILAGQIECLYLLPGPGGAAQEAQAGFDTRFVAKAVDRQALGQSLPTIKADQFREQALQCDAV